MTTLLDRNPPEPYMPPRPKAVLRLPTSGRHRRVALTLASVVVIAVSIAAFADIYASANRQTAVLIVTSTVPQGQPIEADQLGEVDIAVSHGITPIPVSEASVLAGKHAAVTIPAGSLLTAGDVSAAPAIPAGDAVVGLALKAGQLPSAGVEPGDRVMIVETGDPQAAGSASSEGSASGSSSSTSSSGVLVPAASVFGVDQPPAASASDASLLVSVEVSSSLAASVSTAAAADQINLVLLPPTAGGPGGSGASSGATASGGSS